MEWFCSCCFKIVNIVKRNLIIIDIMKMSALTFAISLLVLASCGNGGYEEWNGGKPSGGNGDDKTPAVPASER